jgi:PAS domain-containing protein
MKLLVLQSPDNQSREISLQAGQNVAGRDPGNELHLPSRRVSRKHCSFAVENNRVIVRDLGSANGVVVEGQRISEAELQSGQRIQIGDYLLQFISAPPQQDMGISLDSGSLSGENESAFGEATFGAGAFGENTGTGNQGNDSPFGAGTFGTQAQEEKPFISEGPEKEVSNPFALVPETPKEPAATPNEADNPFGALPDAPMEGFGGQNTSGGFGSNASSFGNAPTPTEQPPKTSPKTKSQDESEQENAFEKLKTSLHRIPWAPKLGALLLGSLLMVMLAPGGGILALLGRAESTMEQMSVEHAVQIVRVSARENALLIPTENSGYSLRNTNVNALHQISGVTPIGALVVDLTGNIKAPPDKVGTPQPEGVASLIKTAVGSQSVVREWNGPLLQIFAPIRFDSGGPAQIVGGIFLEYDPSEFVSDVGRPTSSALIAFIVIGLIFSLIFFLTWRMTNQPIVAIREEVELAIVGHQPDVRFETHWPELGQLVHTINRVLNRAGPGEDNTAQQQLATLLSLAAWPVILTDGELRVTAANPIAARILGGDSAKAIGQPLSHLVSDPSLGQEMKGLLSQLGGAKGKHGTVSVVMDGIPRKLSIAIETSTATGKLAYAVVMIA